MTIEAATAARVARGKLKLKLKRGEIGLQSALEERCAQRMLVGEIISALPFSANPKRQRTAYPAIHAARRVCEIAGIPFAERVERLTADACDQLAIAYAEYYEGARS